MLKYNIQAKHTFHRRLEQQYNMEWLIIFWRKSSRKLLEARVIPQLVDPSVPRQSPETHSSQQEPTMDRWRKTCKDIWLVFQFQEILSPNIPWDPGKKTRHPLIHCLPDPPSKLDTDPTWSNHCCSKLKMFQTDETEKHNSCDSFQLQLTVDTKQSDHRSAVSTSKTKKYSQPVNLPLLGWIQIWKHPGLVSLRTAIVLSKSCRGFICSCSASLDWLVVCFAIWTIYFTLGKSSKKRLKIQKSTFNLKCMQIKNPSI